MHYSNTTISLRCASQLFTTSLLEFMWRKYLVDFMTLLFQIYLIILKNSTLLCDPFWVLILFLYYILYILSNNLYLCYFEPSLISRETPSPSLVSPPSVFRSPISTSDTTAEQRGALLTSQQKLHLYSYGICPRLI